MTPPHRKGSGFDMTIKTNKNIYVINAGELVTWQNTAILMSPLVGKDTNNILSQNALLYYTSH